MTIVYKEKCELCNMQSTHIEIGVDGVTHYFCGHHSLKGVVKKEGDTFKKLLPLLLVFAGIVALASIRVFVMGFDPVMFMMDFMGIFFIVFGLFKLIDLQGFAEGFATYDLFAKKLKAYGYIYPFIEIGLGALYLLGYMFVWQNILIIILSVMGVYTAYTSIKSDKDIRCVCLGTVFDLPMTWVTLTENTVMFFMGVYMVFM